MTKLSKKTALGQAFNQFKQNRIKTCRQCNQSFTLDNFSLIKSTQRPKAACKQCCCQSSTAWYHKNKDHRLKNTTNKSLKIKILRSLQGQTLDIYALLKTINTPEGKLRAACFELVNEHRIDVCRKTVKATGGLRNHYFLPETIHINSQLLALHQAFFISNQPLIY